MRVLLADDHRLVREGMRGFLERLDDEVAVVEAEAFDEAVAKVESGDDFDLIILDLVMPGMNGLSGLERMHALCPEVPIVLLTGFFRRDDVGLALARGADGVIPKTLGGMAMVNALKLVIGGEKYVPSRIFAKISPSERGLADETGSVFGAEGPLETLTRRQRDVLLCLMRGATNREIADQLGLKEVTVKVHLKGVYRKLGVANRTQAVRLALDAGWGG